MSELEKLTADRDKVLRKIKQLEASLAKARGERNKLDAAVHRASIKELLGKPVKLRYRMPASHRESKLNDAIGTLVAVRRSRCTIDFGEHGKWNYDLGSVTAVDQEQGFFMPL